jgi:hypothetical protein
MVETQVKFVVVCHHKRIDAARVLCDRLNAHMLIDYEDHGAIGVDTQPYPPRC